MAGGVEGLRMKFVVSFGAGVNSTAMVLLLRKHGYPIDEIVFVDTGCEFPETYEYLDYLVDDVGWDINIVKPNVSGCSSLVEYCYKYKISPFKNKRWCTVKFKIEPFYKYITRPSIIYKGIDYSEVRRVIPDGRGCLDIYPLVDFKMDRDLCVKMLSKEGIKIPMKSGCFICPFMNKKNREHLRRNHPDLWKIREEVLSFRKTKHNYKLYQFVEGLR